MHSIGLDWPGLRAPAATVDAYFRRPATARFAFVLPNATAFYYAHSSRAPNSSAASSAAGGSTDANTINSVHTRAACFADRRDHVIRLLKRRERHGLRR